MLSTREKPSSTTWNAPQSGPPLLLLHGLGDRWQIFLSIILALSLQWRVYALDLRGHGKSGRVPGGYRPEDYCRDILAFLHSKFDQPAALLGHSAGGIVALWCAAEYSEGVRAVINGDLCASTEKLAALIRDEESMKYYSALRSLAGQPVDQVLTSSMAENVDVADRWSWANTVSQLDPGVLSYHAEGEAEAYLSHFDSDPLLRKVKCPVLLIQGNPKLGGIMTEEDARYAKARIRGISLVSIEHAGHDLGLRAWEADPVLRAVTGFLEAL